MPLGAETWSCQAAGHFGGDAGDHLLVHRGVSQRCQELVQACASGGCTNRRAGPRAVNMHIGLTWRLVDLKLLLTAARGREPPQTVTQNDSNYLKITFVGGKSKRGAQTAAPQCV